MSVSAIILTKDEEKNIGNCLKSVEFCDEIIVIDDYSRDKTCSLILQTDRRIKIFKRKLKGDFAAQRNFGLKQARSEWILFVDADEEVNHLLQAEIFEVLKNRTQYSGFYIKRKDILWGRALLYGETGAIQLIRLGKRNAGIWHGVVHEEWDIKGKIGYLLNPLYHYPHQNIFSFLNSINYYTDLRAKELIERRDTVKAFEIVIYPTGKFFYNYIFRLGFLDGIDGFLISIMMSFHSFLVRGKVWIAQSKKHFL